MMNYRPFRISCHACCQRHRYILTDMLLGLMKAGFPEIWLNNIVFSGAQVKMNRQVETTGGEEEIQVVRKLTDEILTRLEEAIGGSVINRVGRLTVEGVVYGSEEEKGRAWSMLSRRRDFVVEI